MDIALIVGGVLALLVLGAALFSFLNDAQDIDQEEEQEVRQETSAEHERAHFEEASKDVARNKEDIEFYSPGD